MSAPVLSFLDSHEIQPARCRFHENPKDFREIEQFDGSVLTVCRRCGAYLSWVEARAVETTKAGEIGRLELVA